MRGCEVAAEYNKGHIAEKVDIAKCFARAERYLAETVVFVGS